MTTYRELLERKLELEQQIAQKREEELQQAILNIKQLMANYGLTLKDLEDRRGPRRTLRVARAPKYRDPKSGATWSGRGRPPAWFDKQNREAFAVG